MKDDERKEAVITVLSELPLPVLNTALVYAANFQNYGVDVTEKWNTAIAQADALQKVYVKGYAEGASKKERLKLMSRHFTGIKFANVDSLFDVNFLIEHNVLPGLTDAKDIIAILDDFNHVGYIVVYRCEISVEEDSDGKCNG